LDEALPGLENHILGGVNNKIDNNNDEISRLKTDRPPGWAAEVAKLETQNILLNEIHQGIEGHDVFGTTINYSIKKDLITKWSTQFGFNWEISPYWTLRGEYGYSYGQEFLMTGLQYRFAI
jgi:hypothetical protein